MNAFESYCLTFSQFHRIFSRQKVEEMEVCVHMIVRGMVQGVGFRYFVHRRAERLKLTGFVKNLFDGSVEIEAVGDRSLLEELIREVKIGPRSAQMTDLRIDWCEPKHSYTYFEIR